MDGNFLLFLLLALANYQVISSQAIGQQVSNYQEIFIQNKDGSTDVIIDAPYNMNSLPPVQCSCGNTILNPVPPIQCPCGNTILITDCTPQACQSLTDTLNLMIVCNLLQNTVGGKDLALKLAGPVINQLISSPALTYPSPMVSSGGICPALASPNFLAPSLPPVLPSTELVSFAPLPSIAPCSCQSLQPVPTCPCKACSETVPTCPRKCSAPAPCSCEACSSPVLTSLNQIQSATSSCPFRELFVPLQPLPTCSKTYSSSLSTISSCPCEACSRPVPTCQTCSAPISPISPCQCQSASNPVPPCPCQKCSPVQSVPTCPCQTCSQISPCACEACKACPNNLNSMLASFLNYL